MMPTIFCPEANKVAQFLRGAVMKMFVDALRKEKQVKQNEETKQARRCCQSPDRRRARDGERERELIY